MAHHLLKWGLAFVIEAYYEIRRRQRDLRNFQEANRCGVNMVGIDGIGKLFPFFTIGFLRFLEHF
jgi:hypothetical protein